MEFIKEFWQFLMERKLFWIAPIVIVFIILGVLLLVGGVGGGAAAPFIYTLF